MTVTIAAFVAGLVTGSVFGFWLANWLSACAGASFHFPNNHKIKERHEPCSHPS